LGECSHIGKHYQRLFLGVLSLSAYVCYTPKQVVSWIISKVRFAPLAEVTMIPIADVNANYPKRLLTPQSGHNLFYVEQLQAQF